MARHVVLLSNHEYSAPIRCGFQHLAQAYAEMGATVHFVTVGVSPLSVFGRAGRRHLGLQPRPGPCHHADGVKSTILWTPFHPASFTRNRLNCWSSPLFRQYSRLPVKGLWDGIRGADVVIVESSPALGLVPRVAEAAPKPLLVYRVSDDLEAVSSHPVLVEFERAAAPFFDLISVPIPDYKERKPWMSQAVVHPHGLDPRLVDPRQKKPGAYKWLRNVLFVGGQDFDAPIAASLAAGRPDFGFHVIGPARQPRTLPTNLVFHGVLPYEETIPFLQHADIALNTVTWQGLQAQRASLKLMQYDALGLPVVSASEPRVPVRSVFRYEPGDAEGARRALEHAAAQGRSIPMGAGLRTWGDTAGEILACAAQSRAETIGRNVADTKA